MGWRYHVNRIPFTQAFFNGFPLRSEHNALPLHYTSALTVLGHYIRIFVNDPDQAIGLCPYEVVRAGDVVGLLHL